LVQTDGPSSSQRSWHGLVAIDVDIIDNKAKGFVIAQTITFKENKNINPSLSFEL
jgi:hypothetical protein